MSTDIHTQPKSSKAMIWAGRIISALPILGLLVSGVMKILQPPDAVKGFADLGWPLSVAIGLAVVEIGCTIIYAIPQTAVLGAILLTGYLGGAVATHVRIGDYADITAPIIMGVLVWLGLFLRDSRLRALIPLRKV